MSNKLISPIKKYTSSRPTAEHPKTFINDLAKPQQQISVAEYAELYIKNLSEKELHKFKKMVGLGINFGHGIAKHYKINEAEFMQEIRRII